MMLTAGGVLSTPPVSFFHSLCLLLLMPVLPGHAFFISFSGSIEKGSFFSFPFSYIFTQLHVSGCPTHFFTSSRRYAPVQPHDGGKKPISEERPRENSSPSQRSGSRSGGPATLKLLLPESLSRQASCLKVVRLDGPARSRPNKGAAAPFTAFLLRPSRLF